jgi:hypothetical protein
MADNTNPTGSTSQTAVDLIPKFYQSLDNVRFIQSTIDQLVQKGSTRKISGFIGRKNAKSVKGNDVFIDAIDATRQNYQLEPAVVISDKQNNVTFFKDYIDYINQLKAFGGDVSNHQRMNQQEFYSWNPHIDWDKFVNFQQYYWLPYGPETIEVFGQQKDVISTYTVVIDMALGEKEYVFTPNGLTRNPAIKLYRGQTYKFSINSPGEPFSIKTQRTLGTQERYIDQTKAVSNFAVTDGIVTFVVPHDAPDILFYVSENNPDLGGLIQIYDINENSYIDVENDLIGKKTYQLSSGLSLSNGMKVSFGGNVTPEKYASGEFYVEGVGSSIFLVPTDMMEVISPYTQIKTIYYDETPFDVYPWQEATTYAIEKDYVVINRGSKDQNPWSRYNRWFHKDVVAASAIYNGNTLDLDQTARATRPIIEFEPNLKLHNFGQTAGPDVDLIDNFTKDAFSTIEGSIGYNIDNVQLVAGMKVIFLADKDPLVANNIYTVRFINIENSGPGIPQIHLEYTAPAVNNTCVIIRQGLKNQGTTYWYSESLRTWSLAQEKISTNQAPLFDMVDANGDSFSDATIYPGSTFSGTKIFSYAIGSGSNDTILGFPLSYQNINNIGDIKFDFNLATDYFEYKEPNVLLKKYIKTGFLAKLGYTGDVTYANGWEISKVTKYQPAVRIYKNSGRVNNFPLDIFDNRMNLLDLEVRIYINGIRLDKQHWSLVDSSNYKVIKLISDIALTDVLTIRAFSAQPINQNGYYELPINLQNNPLNQDMSSFTLGEVSDHVNSIIDNLQNTFVGTFPGGNNLRDLGNITVYGTKFIQHSSPGSLGLYHITSESNNIVKALEKARDDYGKFKRSFLATAENIGIETDTVSMVDAILKKMISNKSKLAPYYFSDMVPFGGKKVSTYSIVNDGIKTYPLSNIFSNESLSNKAVLIYYKGTQLLYGREYTFTSDGYVKLLIDLELGIDNLVIHEYDSTDGCYVPSTPTKLGLWPKYTPKIYLDTTFITPRTMIQGHDGSLILSYGDYRDGLILELEKRIYNNIKVSYNEEIFDPLSQLPGYSRKTEYSLDEFNKTLAPAFYSWVDLAGQDFTIPIGFNLENAFTYNYSGHSAPDGRGVPGYWRGIFKWMYDTERPNNAPWEILGFSEEPSWWTSVYGPAPYTINNEIMWSDIAMGAVKEPGKPVAYRTFFAKPFLTSHIPVDENGSLKNPLMANVASGPLTADINLNYKFGDGSPAEAAWRKSSYYPFSVISALIVLKPSYTLGSSFDVSRMVRNLAGQLVYTETGLRISPFDMLVPSIYTSTNRIQTSGIVNYLVDQLVHDNLSYYNQYLYDLSNLDTRISYRIGSFTTKANFNLLLDSKNPAATGSIFVPPEDYSIVYNSSSTVKKISYSGVIITKVDQGFEVKGYSISSPYFSYHPWVQSQGAINVGGISSPYAEWASNQNYIAGQIISYNGIYYRAQTATLSGETFNLSSFQKLSSLPVSGGVEADFRISWDTDVVNTVPYGTVLPTVQSVVDFLTGYGEWLKGQGFVFEDYNDNLQGVANWETSAKEFMFWTTQNWNNSPKYVDWQPNQQVPAGTIVRFNGDFYKTLIVQPASAVFIRGDYQKLDSLDTTGNPVISLSPAANKVTFVADMSVVDDISNPFNRYEMLNVDGTTIHSMDLESIRQGNIISYIPANNKAIYNASFYLVQKEQVVVLNNTTMFNDIIYSPTSGYRQERIKVSGFVATEWFGGFEAPGFIFDRADVAQWKAHTDYAIADIVQYQGLYYSANKFTPGSDKFNPTQWVQIAKPSKELMPNWSYKAGQFTDFYDLDNDNFDTGQQQIAQHLIGYQDRTYLDNIVQDKTSEFQFYQGFIREKGTQNSLNKLFDVLSADNKESLKFYEEWAIRVGQYGASNAFENIEFLIDETNSTRNPQGFHLVPRPENTVSNFNVNVSPTDVYLAPTGYDSNPFPVGSNFYPELRTPGYVQASTDIIELSSLANVLDYSISSFKDGTYVWTTFEKTSWNIYRFTNSHFRVLDLNFNQDTGQLNIILAHTVQDVYEGDYIGIGGYSYPGFYKVLSVVDNIIGVDAPNITNFAPFTGQADIVLFLFLSVRIDSIDNANVLTKKHSEVGDKIWTDDDGTGKWANWILTQAYTRSEIVNQDNIISEFKFAVVWKPSTTYRPGTIIKYNGLFYYVTAWHISGATFNSNVTKLSYAYDNSGALITQSTTNIPASTAIKFITPDALSSFGQVVAINDAGTLAAVYTAKGHVGTYEQATKLSPWVLKQVITKAFIAQPSPLNQDPNSNDTFGETIAMSKDGRFLAIGSPNAGYASYTTRTDGTSICSAVGTPTISTKTKTGAVSLYEKDSFNNYNLIFTIVTGNDIANEQFGSNLVFGNEVLFATATASDGHKIVYRIVKDTASNSWTCLQGTPLTAPVYSPDFGKSIVVSTDNKVLAISSPTLGNVYVYNLGSTNQYTLTQTIFGSDSAIKTDYIVSVVDSGFGFKNQISDVYDNLLQNIPTIGGTGSGLTLNLGVDTNGSILVPSIQYLGSGYLSSDRMSVINPLGVGGLVAANIVSGGTGYVTTKNVPVGYSPLVATVSSAIITGNTFTPLTTPSGQFTSGMMISATELSSGPIISSVDTAVQTNVSINGYYMTVGSQTVGTLGNFAIGMVLSGQGVSNNTYIVDQQAGTWVVNNSQTVGPITVTGKKYNTDTPYGSKISGYVSVGTLSAPCIVTPNLDVSGNPTGTSNLELTDLPTSEITVGTFVSGSTTGVLTVNKPLGNKAVATTIISTTGTVSAISGTGPLSVNTEYTNFSGTAPTLSITSTIHGTCSFGGSIDGLVLTVTTLTSGIPAPGYVLTGTSVIAGTYIVSLLSGSPSGDGSTWLVSQSQIVLGTPSPTVMTGTYNAISMSSTAQLQAGASITFASSLGGLSISSTYYITKVISSTLFAVGSSSGATVDYTVSDATGFSLITVNGSQLPVNGQYSNIKQKYTSGAGTGATFTIIKSGGAGLYTDPGSTIIQMTSPGTGYAIGDTITISGTQLGGQPNINDFVFTISTAIGATITAKITGMIPFSSAVAPIGGTLTALGLVGQLYQGSPTTVAISGYIKTDNSVTTSAGTGYVGLVYTISTPGLTPVLGAVADITTPTVGAVTYKSVGQLSTSGTGSEVAFDVTVTGNGTTYIGVTTVNVIAQGGNYAVGDTITIPGNLLGGQTPLNDLQVTVATQPSIPSNIYVTDVIDSVNYTINTNYTAGNTTFPLTMTGTQVTMSVTAVLQGTVAVGQTLSGLGVTPGTMIVSGKDKTWYLNKNFAVGSILSPSTITGAVTLSAVRGDVTGSPGYGATVDIVANPSGVITQVSVNTQGAGYLSTDTLVILGGNNNAKITPQSNLILTSAEYGTLTALANGKLILDTLQYPGTFYVGQKITITGKIDQTSVGKITPYTNTVNITNGLNKGTQFVAYVTATSVINNPSVVDGGKQSNSITLSLTKGGTPLATVPGLITATDSTYPLIITLYYPGVSSNGSVQITSNISNTISSLDYGISMSLSESSKYLAVGSNLFTGQYSQQGKVLVYELANNVYSLDQEIISPRVETGELFGTKISFMNDASTLVVYSAGAASFSKTTIDDNSTTFDLGSLLIVDKTPTSGRVDIFDRYNKVWIAGETLEMDNRTLDGFGVGFAVGSNVILIGAPNALDGILQLPAGKVYTYEKFENTYSWKKIHRQNVLPDLRKIKRVYLYNKISSQLIKHLDIIDPYYGKIAGPADQELSYKTFRDPAIYSYYNTSVYNDSTLPASVDVGQAWTSEYVGKLWWDQRTAKFIDNHSDDVVYRNSMINSLATGASIDVYEWIGTSYLPSEWAGLADTVEGLAENISGKPLYGDDIYSVKQYYDPFTGSFVNTYYYWVKNTIIKPSIAGRKLSAGAVSNLIANPKGEGYQFISLTGTDSFSLNNVQTLLKSSDVVLSIEYWTIENTTQNIHNQWKLVSNDSTTSLPLSVEEKWFDSLCGKDQADRVVPDFNQPVKLRYGIENRPRQSMFVNRFEALKQFVEQANLVFAANPIVDMKPTGITNLNSYELPPPSTTDASGNLVVPSGLYDVIVDTYADLDYVNVNYIKAPVITLEVTYGRITDFTIVYAGAGFITPPVISVIGKGVGATLKAVLDSNGGISDLTIVNPGQGYIGTGYSGETTVSIRAFSALVSQDELANGNWSIYSYNTAKKIWTRTSTQSYDTRLFWSKIDWYGTHIDPTTLIEKSYGEFSPIDYAVDTYNELANIDPAVGEIVKVRTTGTGGWQLLVCTSKNHEQDWTQSYKVIGIQEGTIQLSSKLYNFEPNNIGYDGFLFDDQGYDFSASKELRIILTTIRDELFTDTLKQNYLDLFFTCLRYAFNEQTYIDWAFKTSFVKAQHNLGYLRQTTVYTNDNLVDFENYVKEVVPYRTTVRKYVDNYESIDTSYSMISDFDLPAIYNKLGNQVISSTIQNGKISSNGIGDLSAYPWKNWSDNLGFVVLSIEITDGGSGYLTPPVVTITSNSGNGASAKAFIVNGSVNRIVLLNHGSKYLEAPEITFTGGYSTQTGRSAKAVAIIGTYNGALQNNNVVRSTFVKIKFDRINQKYFVIQLDKSETFAGNGSLAQFELTWAPDIKIGQSSVTIDGVTVLRENYKLTVKKSTKFGYTSYSGLITFITPPPKRSNGDNSSVVVNYIKDVSLLNAQDRIQFSYTPGVGALGKDLSQLMTGVDYGGVQVLGLNFDVSQGWSSAGYMTDLWDSYEDDHSNYSVTVDSTTVGNRIFPLPAIPPIYTNINIYRQEFVEKTVISDGVVTTLYGSPKFNQFNVTATIEKITAGSASSAVTSTNTQTILVTGARIIGGYLYASTAELTTGMPIQFISNMIGGLVLGQVYYVRSIVDANTFTISTTPNGPLQPLTAGASGSNMRMRYPKSNNTIVCDATNFAVGMAVRFTGTVFGNIQLGKTYYVKSISNDLSGFTVSSTFANGSPGTTTTLTNAVGTMYATQISPSGSAVLRLNNTTGLKAGDVIYCNIANAITPNTVIKSIDSSTQITLTTLGSSAATSILYRDIPDASVITFVRTLTSVTDYRFNSNVSITLYEPIVSGAVVSISSYLDPVRIDDPNYDKKWTITNTNSSDDTITAYEPIDFIVGTPIKFTGKSIGGLATNQTYYIHSVVNNRTFKIAAIINGPIYPVTTDSGNMKATNIANSDAVMSTVVVDGTTSSIVLPPALNLNINDVISFIYSTSDGSLASGGSTLDTLISGGDLAYSSATGINPDDIIIDGDGFVTPESSPAPEEVVPGQVVDAVAIKVFERPKDGSAVIKINNYTANGISNNFVYGEYINTKQAIIVKANGQILTNTVDYNIDYKNKQIVMVATPSAGTLITTEAFGFNGNNLLDLDYYISDGITTEFITRATWNTDINILVYIDGLAVSPQLFQTDSTYQNANRIALRFVAPPAVGSVLTYLIVSGTQATYSLIKQERLPTDGVTRSFTLSNSVGSSLPLESNLIVRANQKILLGPNASYFTIGGNQYKYTLDATAIQPYSVSPSQLEVYANGSKLLVNKDYTVDVSGITVSISKTTYSSYKGTRLAIVIANSADYLCTNNTISFNTAYTSGDYVEVTSAYKHDILKIERSRVKASNNISFTTQSSSFYKYTGILGGVINLQNNVVDESYLMVIKNNTLLTPSVDYKLNTDLTSITMAYSLNLNDVIEIILFSGTPVTSGYSFMQFKDMLNRTSYTRLARDKQTTLLEDLHFYDKTITVADAGNFDKPNKLFNRPGVIEINGERIEFFTIDGNVLGQLRRGVLGTGTPVVHNKGTYVQDIGPSETIPYSDSSESTQITVDGVNVKRVIPLDYIPMSASGSIAVNTTIDNWNLDPAVFGLFSSTKTSIVNAKTQQADSTWNVTFSVPQLSTPPAVGKILKVSGSYNTLFNGYFPVTAVDTSVSTVYKPIDSTITGTYGVIIVLDDGEALNSYPSAIEDAGTAGTVISSTDPILDGTNAAQAGSSLQGSVVYSFTISTQKSEPTTGVYYTVSGAVPTQYNGTFLCTASTIDTITIQFPINYGQITVTPTSISGTHNITLKYPTDPGVYNTITTATIAAPLYQQSDDLDVFVGGYDTSTAWEPLTDYTSGQLVTINSYVYKITVDHTSGTTFNSLVTLSDETTATATSVRSFFIGNTRLKKHPYSVHNIDIAPESPAGDVSFTADFAVDTINKELILTNDLTAGTVVFVTRRFGTKWAIDTGDISTSQEPLAKFITIKPGVGYQGSSKISTVSTVTKPVVTFDSSTETFDSNIKFDQGRK